MTHAAASLVGREVRILKRLLCFKRVNRAHRVWRPFGTQGQFKNSYSIDNKQFMWYPEGDLNSDTLLKTMKLLKTMRATNAENCRYAVIWYVLGTRAFVLNLLRLRLHLNRTPSRSPFARLSSQIDGPLPEPPDPRKVVPKGRQLGSPAIC